MSLISEAGSYRGIVLEHAVAATSSGLPQFMLKVRALEQFEKEEKVWLDYQTKEDNEITAYLVLFKKNGDPIFHVKDIMRVFEWDGGSLTGLNNLDLEGAEIQFEVAEHTYDGKTSMQVQNIRGYNDEPGSSLKKLDAAELSQLNAKSHRLKLKHRLYLQRQRRRKPPKRPLRNLLLHLQLKRLKNLRTLHLNFLSKKRSRNSRKLRRNLRKQHQNQLLLLLMMPQRMRGRGVYAVPKKQKVSQMMRLLKHLRGPCTT